MNKTEIETRLTSKLEEMKKLENEIKQLRILLDNEHIPRNELRLSKEEQVQIFKSYFRGRYMFFPTYHLINMIQIKNIIYQHV